jgi:hypothetical protein
MVHLLVVSLSKQHIPQLTIHLLNRHLRAAKTETLARVLMAKPLFNHFMLVFEGHADVEVLGGMIDLDNAHFIGDVFLWHPCTVFTF